MAIERADRFPRPHKFTVEEYLAFEERSEFKHEFIDGVIYDWGDPLPEDPVHPDYVPGYPMPHLFTVEEYLVFEAESEAKHDFIDGIIYEMTSGTSKHSDIDDVIPLDMIGCDLPLSDIYRGIDLSED
jgi:Uma2 family endonuclease